MDKGNSTLRDKCGGHAAQRGHRQLLQFRSEDVTEGSLEALWSQLMCEGGAEPYQTRATNRNVQARTASKARHSLRFGDSCQVKLSFCKKSQENGPNPGDYSCVLCLYYVKCLCHFSSHLFLK
jgi:hypothetical protein